LGGKLYKREERKDENVKEKERKAQEGEIEVEKAK
jgi:hypothetical protein